MGIGWTELLVIILLVVLVFGARRIPEVGNNLGAGIRNFRKAMRGESEEKKSPPEDKPSETPK